MKLERTCAAGLYLLMMVLLPFLHLMETHHADDAARYTECASHDAESAPNKETHHEADDCSLCQLLVLAADQAATYAPVECAITLVSVVSEPAPTFPIIPSLPAQARAPPRMLV
jgi:hypothetical protein